MRIAKIHDPNSWWPKRRVSVDLRVDSYAVKRLLTETLPVDDVAHLLRCTRANVNHVEVTAFCMLMSKLRNDPEAVDLAREYFAECEESRTDLPPNMWDDFSTN